MLGKSLVAGVAFFFFDSIFLVAAQQPSPELALDEAARAFDQGKTAEAEQMLHPVLEKHPTDLRALLLEGAVLELPMPINALRSRASTGHGSGGFQRKGSTRTNMTR